MKRNKKIIVILIIILSVLINTGCWDRRDFEKFILIKGIAVDKAEDENRVKYTVQVIVPSPEAGGSKPAGIDTYTLSSTGYSLYDANRNLVKQTGKKPFYGHSEVIIFSEEIAKKGISPYLDYFIRDPEIRGRSSIVVAKGEAEDILKAKHGIETITSTGIKTMVDGVSISGTIVTVDLIHFLRQLFNDTTCAVASAIELRKKEGGAESQEQSKGGGNQQGEQQEEEILYAEGGFFFKGDKSQGVLTRKEARGLNWIIDPQEVRGPVLIHPPDESQERKIAIEITRTESKLRPKLVNGEFIMGVYIVTEGNIIEDMSRKYDITEPANTKQLNKRFATVVNNEIINALKRTQKVGADVFGFGESIYRKYPQEFMKIKKEWPEYYKKLKLDIDVRADIRREGMVKEGVGTHRSQ